MNQVRLELSNKFNHLQNNLFPWLQEELGPLSKKQKKLVAFVSAHEPTHPPKYSCVQGGSNTEVLSILENCLSCLALFKAPTDLGPRRPRDVVMMVSRLVIFTGADHSTNKTNEFACKPGKHRKQVDPTAVVA